MFNQIKVTTKWLLSLTLTTLLSTTIHAYDQAGDGAAGDSMDETQKTDYGVVSSNATTYDTAAYAAAASQVSNYNEALQARHEAALELAGQTSWSRDINATVGDIKLYHSEKHSNAVIGAREAFNIAFTENTEAIDLGSFNGYYDLKDDSIVYNRDEMDGITGTYALGGASWSGSEEFQMDVQYQVTLNNAHPDVQIQTDCSDPTGGVTTSTAATTLSTTALMAGGVSHNLDAAGGSFDIVGCTSSLIISDNLDSASIGSLDALTATTSVTVSVSNP